MTSLTPSQLDRREKALDAAALVLAEATHQMAETYARGGAMAVAEAAWVPGGPPKEELAARYEGWVQEERAKRASEAA